MASTTRRNRSAKRHTANPPGQTPLTSSATTAIVLRTIPIDQAKDAPYNPRVKLRKGTKRYTAIQRSLETFGLVQPIVWNETTGHIVGGHQRAQVIRDRGDKTLEVAVVAMTLEREKALNLALNNDAVGSTWDTTLLADLLASIADLPEADATGFTTADLKALRFQPVEQSEELTTRNSDRVIVTVIIDPQDWPRLRSDIDNLLSTNPRVECHVTNPETKSEHHSGHEAVPHAEQLEQQRH